MFVMWDMCCNEVKNKKLKRKREIEAKNKKLKPINLGERKGMHMVKGMHSVGHKVVLSGGADGLGGLCYGVGSVEGKAACGGDEF